MKLPEGAHWIYPAAECPTQYHVHMSHTLTYPKDPPIFCPGQGLVLTAAETTYEDCSCSSGDEVTNG